MVKHIETEEEVETIAEAIDYYYRGEVVQIFCGDAGGAQNYSDFDIEEKLYIEGKVLWGKHMLLALECEFELDGKKYKKNIFVNGWNIHSAIKSEDNKKIKINSLFKGGFRR